MLYYRVKLLDTGFGIMESGSDLMSLEKEMRNKSPKYTSNNLLSKRRGKESYNSQPTWNFLWWNIKCVLEFNQTKKELWQELSHYGERVKIFKHSKEA